MTTTVGRRPRGEGDDGDDVARAEVDTGANGGAGDRQRDGAGPEAGQSDANDGSGARDSTGAPKESAKRDDSSDAADPGAPDDPGAPGDQGGSGARDASDERVRSEGPDGSGDSDESGGADESGQAAVGLRSGGVEVRGRGRFVRRRTGKQPAVTATALDTRQADEKDRVAGRSERHESAPATPKAKAKPEPAGGGSNRGGSGDEHPASRNPFRRKGRPRRRPKHPVLRVVVQVAIGLLVAVFAYVAITFVQVWHASRTNTVRPSDAIVVLGAAQYDCTPSPVLRGRLDHALALWEDHVAPRIVVTGGRRASDRCSEAQAGADYLRSAGVPDSDLLLEVKGRNTWESLASSANFLTDEGYNRVVLVTDDYHALRVRAIADELGLEPVVSPVGANATFRELARETGAVAVGRVVGFRRLVRIDDRLVPDAGG